MHQPVPVNPVSNNEKIHIKAIRNLLLKLIKPSLQELGGQKLNCFPATFSLECKEGCLKWKHIEDKQRALLEGCPHDCQSYEPHWEGKLKKHVKILSKIYNHFLAGTKWIFN